MNMKHTVEGMEMHETQPGEMHGMDTQDTNDAQPGGGMAMDAQGGMAMQGMGHTGMPGMAMGGMAMDSGALKRKLIISAILALPILLLSPIMGLSLPFQPSFAGSHLVVALFATLLYFYGGSFFLRGAVREVRSGHPAMMMLVSLGITVAYLYSMYTFVLNELRATPGTLMDFFWEFATLVVIMLFGHWVEMRAVDSAGDAVRDMARLLPDNATLVQAGGGTKSVPLSFLRAGQTVLVKAGERMPADGRVLEGETSVDEALVTGEAKSVHKTVGDSVIGGSQNGEGTVQVKITGTGETGYLAKVMRLVADAQGQKSRAAAMADRVAGWLFYAALIASVLALVIWLFVARSFDEALARMVTVLVIACPHALGLAVPLVTARSTSLAAKNGLLIRRQQALEEATKTSVVAMDKTGTLTEGKFQLTKAKALRGGLTPTDVLRIAAALEAGSSHPLAAGILTAAQEDKLKVEPAQNIQNKAGEGVFGVLPDGQNAALVSTAYLRKRGIAYDAATGEKLAAQGATVSWLLLDDAVAGALAQGDRPKPNAPGLVHELKKQHITPLMLTGDSETAAAAIAGSLGVEEYRAALLPEDKQTVVQQLHDKGETVMMVGDGVNDAPALAAADVAVAIGAGTDVAQDSADIVLVRSDPEDVVTLLDLADATQAKLRQNLWWAAGYNIVAIPLAAGVLAPFGITLSPAVGALLMSISTIIVALNAFSLKLDK